MTPTTERIEPHAVTRLRERFGVELSIEQLRWLSMMLADPIARLDWRRFRFVRRLPGCKAIIQINLEHITGYPLWVAAVVSDDRGRLITVLPYEANLSVTALDKVLQSYVQSRGRKPSYSERYQGTYLLRQGARRA